MESVGLAALGWVASPVVEELVSKGISYLGSDIAKGLEDLETTLLPQFQLTIRAAQNSTDKDMVDMLAKWLARLKNAYYNAEAILHDLEYERLKRKANGDSRKLRVRISSHPIIKPLANVTRKVSQKVSLLSPQKKRLWDQLHELKEIAAEAKVFRDLLGTQSGNEYGAPVGNRTLDTSALLRDKVFGRDEDRDKIIDLLLDEQGTGSSTRGYSVIAITGIGGAGKTTLAQYVYNNEKVKNLFAVRMWLCLSENKDVKERTKKMIECASRKKFHILDNLTALQDELIETLPKSESILLVLDDVWYDESEENYWDSLMKPFASIEGRCKIVVTSRGSSFPKALEPSRPPFGLSDLALEDFKLLFRYYAIDNLEFNDQRLKDDLFVIADQIATKISKSPLAAKSVGNQLRKRPDKSFWQDTLKNDILSSTRKVLLWSYQHLDVQLQRCFLFWGLFPKGFSVNSGNELVQLWVALDFIQSSVIGFEYFNTMVANSMLQLVDGKYCMHDLFLDLAENLSARDNFRVKNFEKEIPSTALYAYIEVNDASWKNNLSSICDSKNLRALSLNIRYSTVVDPNKVLSMVAPRFKNLRVLVVFARNLKELPSVVGDLRNLRYLEVWESSIEELPDSVSRLYHLQFLLLPTSIKTLPPKVSDLIKLRSIVEYDRDYNLVDTLPPVPYLGKLTSLQSLGEFHVRKEEGYELRQLGSLREIAGSLRIVNLNNVRQKDEAVEARLIDKSELKKLELVWTPSSENRLDLEVIEALRPTANLEDLSIKGYRGSEYPSWLEEGLFLKNIKHLKFYNCPCLIFACQNELQLNENQGTMKENSWILYSRKFEGHIKEVFDHEVESFKQTGSEQNHLEQLKIIERAAEDSTSELTDDVEKAWWHCHQQRMNFMFRRKPGANKLILPPMLSVLEISYCCISKGALSDCLRGMAALEKLILKGIMTITALPPAEVLKFLQSLRVLEIRYCWCLRSLGGLHALPNLETFLVEDCWSLKMNSDVELPPTLQSLTIAGCQVSETLLGGNLPSLEYIRIRGCSFLKFLSLGHLTSLKSLHLEYSAGLHHIENFAPRSFIDNLSLVQILDLNVESVLKSWQGCRKLYISSSVMLNKLLLSENFDALQTLVIEDCEEEVISFEKSDHLQSIKTLGFTCCNIKNLPPTLSDFSNLENIVFLNCSRISSLPELPDSVRYIRINNCPILEERCQLNGPDWYKIQHIAHMIIE